MPVSPDDPRMDVSTLRHSMEAAQEHVKHLEEKLEGRKMLTRKGHAGETNRIKDELGIAKEWEAKYRDALKNKAASKIQKHVRRTQARKRGSKAGGTRRRR